MSDTDDKTKPKPKLLPAFPNSPGPQYPHACLGLNACKNLGRTQDNDCAGAGYCATTLDHTCHVQNQCKDQGGCGLYGNAEEFSHPAENDCKFQGSCATPINAERFFTTSPTKAQMHPPKGSEKHPLPDLRGKSVWHQARLSFEQRWNDGKVEIGTGPGTKPNKGPKKLLDVPEGFENGPSYEWLTHYGKCSDMTACGASGLSGAGSCS